MLVVMYSSCSCFSSQIFFFHNNHSDFGVQCVCASLHQSHLFFTLVVFSQINPLVGMCFILNLNLFNKFSLYASILFPVQKMIL